jgi:hypothetical protein
MQTCLIKVLVAVSYLFVIIASVGLILFATRFSLSTRIKDLKDAKERLCCLNGYRVYIITSVTKKIS